MPGNRITCNADLKSIAFVRQSRSEDAGFRHSCEGHNPLKAATWNECCRSDRLFAASLAQHTRVATAKPPGKLAEPHRNAVFLHPLRRRRDNDGTKPSPCLARRELVAALDDGLGRAIDLRLRRNDYPSADLAVAATGGIMTIRKPVPAGVDVAMLASRLSARTESDRVQSYQCQLVTPMYGGGVAAGEVDLAMPIRATAIRGQLRFWWRLLHGECANSPSQTQTQSRAQFRDELAIFGGLREDGTLKASALKVRVTQLRLNEVAGEPAPTSPAGTYLLNKEGLQRNLWATRAIGWRQSHSGTGTAFYRWRRTPVAGLR